MKLRSLCVAMAAAFLGCGGSSDKKTTAAASLVAIDADASEGCDDGGTRIRTGRDTNGNGTLDDGEVTGTQYVCAPGQGPGTLLSVSPLGEGEGGCVYGGNQIDTGADDNNDGTLDGDEIDDTHYVCNDGGGDQINPWDGIYIGDVEIYSQADLAKLDGIKVVLGDLYVSTSFDGDFSAPELESVTAGIYFDNCDSREGKLESATFPALTSTSWIEIYGDCSPYELSLSELSFPVLTTLADFEIEYIGSELAVDFPLLETVTSEFELYAIDDDVTVSVPSLTFIGELYIEELSIEEIAFPALQEIGYLYIQYVSLGSLSFPELTTVNDIELRYMELGGLSLPTLASVYELSLYDVWVEPFSAPLLTTVDELSFENCGIETIDLPLLAWVEELYIGDNESLTSAAFPALVEIDDHATIEGNELLEGPMFAALDYANSVNVYDNPALSGCVEIKLRNAATAGVGYYDGNNNGAACEDPAGLCPVFAPLSALGEFRYCHVQNTFDDARELCQDLGEGYDLAFLNSAAEATALMTLRYDAENSVNGPLSGNDLWVGLTDRPEEGTWSWVAGESTYAPDVDTSTLDEFWASQEPDNEAEDFDCAMIADGTGRAFSVPCEYTPYALCRLAD